MERIIVPFPILALGMAAAGVLFLLQMGVSWAVGEIQREVVWEGVCAPGELHAGNVQIELALDCDGENTKTDRRTVIVAWVEAQLAPVCTKEVAARTGNVTWLCSAPEAAE